MITKKELEVEMKKLEGLNDMVQAFEEIAASRMMHSRQSVLSNRNFIEELNLIFAEVIASYKKQLEKKSKGKKSTLDLSFLHKNNKTLYLLVSANTGLYGSLVKRTFDLFNKSAKLNQGDVAIIGRLGLSMWKQKKIKKQYYYFDFPDQTVNEKDLKKILDFIISYEKVIVYYGKFQNLVTQDVTFSDISGQTLPENQADESKIKYVYEPSLPNILEFFEKQIFVSIFEQTMRESQLAKLASRLTTLDNASVNINKNLEMITNQKNVSFHRQQNKKQLETFASRSLWGKT